jgi:hypothetical protein
MDDVKVKRDLEQQRLRNEDRKRCEIATETAVRKLEIDWSLFQSEVAQLNCCNGDCAPAAASWNRWACPNPRSRSR